MLIFSLLLVDSIIISKVGVTQKNLSSGQYIVHCYGAQGGGSMYEGAFRYPGGLGAHVSGTMNIKGREKVFYFFVGGEGGFGKNPNEGGFNGGGNAGIDTEYGKKLESSGGGGGATDVRVEDQDYHYRIIVAGGGSGGANACKGAPAGTYKCMKATSNNVFTETYEGNTNGQGGHGEESIYTPGSGGGGGYFGGISHGEVSWVEDSSYKAVSHSGSSFISGFDTFPITKGIAFTEGKMEGGVNEGDGYINLTTVFICPENCDSCTAANKCTMCFDKFFLHNGGKECVSKCPSGFIAKDGRCEKCDSEN